VDRDEYNKLYNIRLSLGLASMRLANEEGADVDDVNEELEALDALLERAESQFESEGNA
jgi:hypothetical protein